MPAIELSGISNGVLRNISLSVRDGECLVLVGATVIANDWDDLVDGSISAPINVDASGQTRTGDVWTGTLATGASYLSSDCGGFTNGTTGVALCGTSSSANSTWTQNIAPSCSTLLRLYCFEQ